MKIFQCDFCKQAKPCTSTIIDCRSYDICGECKASRDEQLKNCGEPNITVAPSPWPCPMIWPLPVPMYPQLPANPTPFGPVIIWSNQNVLDDGHHVTCGNRTTSNTLRLT